MPKILYTTSEHDNCIIQLHDEQVEPCIAAELETAKREFGKKGSFVCRTGKNKLGQKYTMIQAGSRWTRWTRLGT